MAATKALRAAPALYKAMISLIRLETVRPALRARGAQTNTHLSEAMCASRTQHSAGSTTGSSRGRGYYPVPRGLSHPCDVECRHGPTELLKKRAFERFPGR